MNKRRYLSGNAGSEGPSSLLFFDSESHSHVTPTDPDVQRLSLRLWCAITLRLEAGRVTRRAVHRGDSPGEFHELVRRCSSPHRVLWAFAHNLGHDLTQLGFWRALDRGEYTVGPVERGVSSRTGKPLKPWTGRLCLESRPTFCVVRNAVGKVRFVDTTNYWPGALAELGESYGVPKLPMPAFERPDREWFHYCENDCKVIEAAVVSLLTQWRRENCGVFKMTAPSLAFTNFKHTCPARTADGEKVDIVTETESPARKLERDGYYGGRIEPFYVGAVAGPVYHYDCNSLYPHVMRKNLYPRARLQVDGPTDPRKLNRALHAYGAVARVKINSRDNTYIVRRNGVQYHARGVFWTTLVGPELVRALAAGDVAEVSESHLYSMAELFTEWVDYWYARKSAAREKGPESRGEYAFVNLILKSLSGKFGQVGEHWMDVLTECPRSRWGPFLKSQGRDGPVALWRAVAGKSQCKVPGAEPAEAYPMISAYITSYAREYMRDVFDLLPPKSCFYSATDSVVCDQRGSDRLTSRGLVHPTELGAFKLQQVGDSAEFRGPNYYRVGERWCRAGLYARARQTADGKWVADAWQQLASILAREPDGSILIRTHELKPSQVNQKGTVQPDGWTVPLRLSLDDDFGDKTPRLREPRHPRRLESSGA